MSKKVETKVEEVKEVTDEMLEEEAVVEEEVVVEDKPKKKLFGGITVKGVLVGVGATLLTTAAGVFLLGRGGNTDESTIDETGDSEE